MTNPDLLSTLHAILNRAPPECWLMGEAWDKAVAEKRQRHEDMPDPKRNLAEFVAGEFVKAGMVVEYEAPPEIRSPLEWSGER